MKLKDLEIGDRFVNAGTVETVDYVGDDYLATKDHDKRISLWTNPHSLDMEVEKIEPEKRCVRQDVV